MKVILYMATTVNGIIAKEDDSADFLTDIEGASYVQAVCDAGALIIGRRTYEVLSTQPEFEEFVNAGVAIVAVSRGSDLNLKNAEHSTVHSPQEAIEKLAGHERVIVAGGGKLDASFMEAGLIDEIYVDIEPAILGKGIPLFRGGDFECELALLGHKMLSDNEIQLHYKILK